jgi:hypothetical protein
MSFGRDVLSFGRQPVVGSVRATIFPSFNQSTPNYHGQRSPGAGAQHIWSNPCPRFLELLSMEDVSEGLPLRCC